MDKIIRNGKVAVIISPDDGAGWFSWNRDIPESLFDPDIVKLIEEKADAKTIEALAESKWPDGHWSATRLIIEWIQEGTEFEVRGYDSGSESLEFANRKWITA